MRIVGRLRERGHTLEQIRRASESGQLAGYVQGMFAPQEGRYTLRQAAREAEIDEELIERIYMSLGLSTLSVDSITEEDMEMLRYIAAMLNSGLPEVAFLQLARVYGQTLAQIADAEVRLIHIYVHEPMMREGFPACRWPRRWRVSPASFCLSPRRSCATCMGAFSGTSSSRT